MFVKGEGGDQSVDWKIKILNFVIMGILSCFITIQSSATNSYDQNY